MLQYSTFLIISNRKPEEKTQNTKDRDQIAWKGKERKERRKEVTWAAPSLNMRVIERGRRKARRQLNFTLLPTQKERERENRRVRDRGK